MHRLKEDLLPRGKANCNRLDARGGTDPNIPVRFPMRRANPPAPPLAAVHTQYAAHAGILEAARATFIDIQARRGGCWGGCVLCFRVQMAWKQRRCWAQTGSRAVLIFAHTFYGFPPRGALHAARASCRAPPAVATTPTRTHHHIAWCPTPFHPLQEHHVLHDVLLDPAGRCHGWRLVLSGHSLGAGCAFLLALYLRHFFPHLK